MQREHTLPSGETIIIDSDGGTRTKPWAVLCVAEDGEEIRWQVYFATQEEAEKEYIRFD